MGVRICRQVALSVICFLFCMFLILESFFIFFPFLYVWVLSVLWNNFVLDFCSPVVSRCWGIQCRGSGFARIYNFVGSVAIFLMEMDYLDLFYGLAHKYDL
jgi:hypothetical protein